MAYDLPQEGTRRLRLALGWTGVAAGTVALAIVIVAHGAPYQMVWWAVMLALLGLSFLAGRLLAPVLEWIIAGYRAGG